MFSWHTWPPVPGNGSTANEVAASVASEVAVDGVGDSGEAAPNTQSVVRQEEELVEAQVPIIVNSSDAYCQQVNGLPSQLKSV